MADSKVINAYTTARTATPSAGVSAGNQVSPINQPEIRSSPAAISSVDQLLEKLSLEADQPGPQSSEIPPIIAGISLAEPGAVRKPRILLAVSGSVATIKLSLLAKALIEFAEVHIISSKSSRHFFTESDLPPECLPILTDEDEWRQWRKVGDPVVHIELRRWADMLVIAPLSANTLAKIANGLCDNLLTCVVRAWDFHKPMLVAPAMNTYMWTSPFTDKHLNAIQELGVQVIEPVSKKLACGDVGVGGMASPESIAGIVRTACIDAGFVVEEGLVDEAAAL